MLNCSANQIQLITVCKRSCWKVMSLDLCVILFTGGGGLPDRDPLDREPLDRDPPLTETPLDRDAPWTETPLDIDPPGQRPPRTETSLDRDPLDRDPPGQRHPLDRDAPWKETPLYSKERSVRIPLECILVPNLNW